MPLRMSGVKLACRTAFFFARQNRWENPVAFFTNNIRKTQRIRAPGKGQSIRTYVSHEGFEYPGASWWRGPKICKTSTSLETSSSILRAGRAIFERARKKSASSYLGENVEVSGPRHLSRILRKPLRTLFLRGKTKESKPRYLSRIRHGGVRFPRAGARETHFCHADWDFTSLFIERELAGPTETWHRGQVYQLKENPGPEPFPGKTHGFVPLEKANL